MIFYILGVVMGYIFGSFNTAMFIGKRNGIKDIRTVGSHNAGASNITVTLGWKFGIITAVADIIKGVFPVLIIRLIVPDNDIIWAVTALSVIFGHNYPIHLKFKGGKGTACFFGVLLAIDYRIALILGAVIIMTTIATDYIAVGTIVTVLLNPILLYIYGYSWGMIIIFLCLAIVSIYKHRNNIINIIQNKEGSLRDTL